jgi:hypothetical protein
LRGYGHGSVAFEQATFKLHCDKSDLTFNVCLHATEDLQGSSVGFYRPADEESPGGDEDEEARRVLTYTHSVGRCVMHSGRTWHKTDELVRGERASLIIWARICRC